MDAIQLMIDEHVNIKRMLTVVRNVSFKIMNGSEICYEDFEQIIDFIRNYADNYHHGKEEKMLFNRMIEEIGTVGEKLVKYGMLIEHDLGRLFIQDLELALDKVKNGEEFAKIDVIANAVGYTNLLTRHIDKEDTVVYQFAKKQLKEETICTINTECSAFEENAKQEGIEQKYIEILEKLENKYNN